MRSCDSSRGGYRDRLLADRRVSKAVGALYQLYNKATEKKRSWSEQPRTIPAEW